MRAILILVVVVVSTACSATRDPSPGLAEVLAWSDRDASEGAQDEHGAGGGGAHAGHGAGTQGVMLFVGGSGEVGDTEGITFGLDYAYRLLDHWGVGVFAEGVTGLDRSFATGVQGYWFEGGGLVLSAGPGVERHHGEWKFLGRFGVLYEVPVGDGFVVAPSIFYDALEGEDLWLYGLSFGYNW